MDIVDLIGYRAPGVNYFISYVSKMERFTEITIEGPTPRAVEDYAMFRNEELDECFSSPREELPLKLVFDPSKSEGLMKDIVICLIVNKRLEVGE